MTTLRIRDDMGRDVLFGAPPQRIVSLVPSETHTLFELGVGDRIVGRTRYCVEPKGAVESIPVVGGTKDVDPEAVAALEPDFVLGNQEENARPPLEKLAEERIRLFVSFPRSVADAVAHVARLGRILRVEKEPAAKELVRDLYRMTQELGDGDAGPKVFVPVWMDPIMTFGSGTFADEVLAAVGARNSFADRKRNYPLAADLGKTSPLPADRIAGRDTRYPRITIEEIETAGPDMILLPDEPHECTDEDRERLGTLDVPAAKTGNIHFVSGKDLFWPGAWLRTGLPRLTELIAQYQ